MRRVALLLLAGCSDLRTQTRAFVATTPCGQGPFDVHIVADGKTGEEGLEVIACTAHQLVGHVELSANRLPLANRTFGEVADNRRCLAGGAVTVTQAAGTSAPSTAGSGAPGTTAASPTLVEQAYRGGEPISGDQLCAPYGLQAQTIYGSTTITTDFLQPGMDLHLRIWSDAPNDLEHAVFMIRHLTSTHTLAEVKQDMKEHEHDSPSEPSPQAQPPPTHGAPPAPLVEERPARTTARAQWIAGYWTWTGTAWGWIAGFWRDDQLAMPDPRVELPGAPPQPTAVWIGGAWQARAGTWIWIRGRWR